MRFKVADRIRIETYNPDGTVREYRETYDHNNIDHRIMAEHGDIGCFANDIILDAGLADLAYLVANRYDYISVGTGSTTPEHDDVTLESEILDRAVAATSISTTFYTNDTANWSGTFTPSYTVTITESGVHLLSGPTGDITFARETFSALECIADRQFTINWSTIFMR